MRQRQLSLLKEMANILKQAHESIRKVIAMKIIDEEYLNAANKLLTECQTNAINMGNLIEEYEGEGFITVKYLEDYCELVFSINEEIQKDSGTDNPDRVYKKLNKMLQKIDNSIAHDIPLKREAVFLPYKASMWDSLESVWEAADADPDCDAYVIPIPYFDKNPDGSVREEHYEADLFPENVPITHYSEYDFGKHHPDMIFIHNPYDYGNLVTTIHPFFYAENMKKVTDCLVYIPYFVTSGAMSESRAWCPVYDYVDYIVIQAESYRRLYSPDIPDEKFLPFGSPKFDKVIRKCQNPPEPPKEWKKKINDRKVYFYNTSLNGMLANTPQFLKKMQFVFETFKEHPECCLLWRPHPLFESTLYAMRPECIEVFNALKEDFFKQENWIYDDTPCVEDTIAICDGYIGDSASSIVALFGVAGKRIFILNNNIVDREYTEPISRMLLPEKIYKEENNPHNRFSITEENVLYWSKEENYGFERYIDFLDSFIDSAYNEIYKYEKKIILAPCTCQNIAVINEDKSVKFIEIEQINDAKWAFEESYFIGNKLVLVPHDYPAIVIVNIENYMVEYVNCGENFIRQKDSEGYHYGSSWESNGWVFVTDAFCNEIIRINTDNLNFEVLKVDLGIESKRIVASKCEGDECWIFHVDGPLVTRFNYKTNEFKTINLYVNGLQSNYMYGRDKYYFDNVVQCGNRLLFSPLFANKIIEYNLSSGEVCVAAVDGLITEGGLRKIGYFINDDCVFYNYSSGKCYKIKEKGVEEIKLSFNETEVKEDLKKFKKYGEAARYCNLEKGLNLLGDYLEYYDEYSFEKNNQIMAYEEVNASIDGDSGVRIYEKIKNNSR